MKPINSLLNFASFIQPPLFQFSKFSKGYFACYLKINNLIISVFSPLINVTEDEDCDATNAVADSETKIEQPEKPCLKKKKINPVEKNIIEAVNMVKNKFKERDEEDIFGSYIATSLRKFRPNIRAVLKLNIQKLITEAELETLNSACDI